MLPAAPELLTSRLAKSRLGPTPRGCHRRILGAVDEPATTPRGGARPVGPTGLEEIRRLLRVAVVLLVLILVVGVIALIIVITAASQVQQQLGIGQ